MLDMFHFPIATRNDVQVYSPSGADFQVWQKPQGCTMAYFFVLAAGGGGGAGHCRAAGTAGGGGGGGACGGFMVMMYPLLFLPEQLYVRVGRGGNGGAGSAITGTAGGAGVAGENSYIALGHSSGANQVLLSANNVVGGNTAGGGAGGTAAAAGTGGTVPTIHSYGNEFYSYKLGICPGQTGTTNPATVGLVGLAGGAQTGAVGNSGNTQTNIVTPGAGGGGIATTTNFNGGTVNFSAAMELPDLYITNAWMSAAGAGVNGSNGMALTKPFLNLGGGGGGTLNDGQAGHGGAGGYGSGGGGGGAGLISGNGGNGGNGMVAIICW